MDRNKEANDKIKEYCKDKGFTFEEFEYLGFHKTQIKMMCTNGHTWNAPYSLMRTNSGCPSCAGVKKITQKQATTNVTKICNKINFHCEPFIYIGSLKTKLNLTCPSGHKLTNTTYSKFIHRDGITCRECNGYIKKTQADAEFEVSLKCTEKKYTFEPFVYNGVDDTFLTLTCSNGHTWNTTSYYHLVKRNNGCLECSGNKMYSQKKADELVNDMCIKNNYTCENFSYIGVDKTILNLTCHKKHTFQYSFYSFTKKESKCKECNSHESFKLSSIIDPIFLYYEKEKSFDDCRNIRPLPFDRYVPELNLLIEYDGEQHFEYIEFIHKNEVQYENMKARDSIKTKYAIDKGFNFIRIAYFEDCHKTLSEMIESITSTPNQVVKIHGKLIE